jgi:hypothetical protein
MVEADCVRVGPWSNALRKGKEKQVWMSMRIRSWHGWFRHITLSMVALADFAAERANGEEAVLKKSPIRRLMYQKHLTLFHLRCLLISQLWFPSVLPKSGDFSFADVGQTVSLFCLSSGLVILATHTSSSRTALPRHSSKCSRQSSTTVGLGEITNAPVSLLQAVYTPD